MSWFVYAFICALSLATADALSKKALNDNIDPSIVAWIRTGYTVPFMVLIIPFIEKPELDGTFYRALFSAIPLDIIALLLYMKAIKISPLSLTLPFLSLTPVFLIGTSYIILGERPDGSGLIGIVLVVIGAYLLNVHTISRGLLQPFKAIAKEHGSLLMIIVAFTFSIGACIGKIAVQHSDPVFFSVIYSFLLSFFLFLVISFRNRQFFSKVTLRPVLFLLIGILITIMIITHVKAISLVEVAYMVSVKRLSILFGVIYGVMFFKEKNIKERLLGATVMVSGIITITVF
ncbi:permeases [Candidatus Scalindua japonica]|uniref:Permeases n=1 Tax=Candidatus Scalindua japonica TaxID=1284222 RepID=A0A286TXN2_9BACT|nr:DMT family transporter [Candidatus Scalindua japonica]GAX60648.1 permeases [Candidatus Scalindua japonica]